MAIMTPNNVQVSTVGIVTTITWDIQADALGYKIYLDSSLIMDTKTNTVTIERELYGEIYVTSYNESEESEKSDGIFIRTVPNPALWADIGYAENPLGYDIDVVFTDNSIIESHYKVKYSIDDSTVQAYTIDTENVELPPDTVLDETKTYLMWSGIQKTDGTDIEIQGVEGEEIHKIKIDGNTDDTGYYPMSIGTVDPLSVGVNDESTPILFETKVVSKNGEAKKVVDVARFQDIHMIIEGKTERDEQNNTLNSVKPMIYNEKGIAHTITLDNIKGKTEVRFDKLVAKEVYGCTLGHVEDVIDQLYKDKVIYRTKQYNITGRESWQIDSSKTNSTYTSISNIKLDNCPTYGADDVFKMMSNKFTAQAYSSTNYEHLRCMCTDKLTLMFKNTEVGITGTDSTSSKITKCKNYLVQIEASIRYTVAAPEIVQHQIDFFVGDFFDLGSIGNVKDICNTKTGEVVFETEGIKNEYGEEIYRKPIGIHQKQYGLRVDLVADTFTRLGDAVGKTLNDFYQFQPWCDMYREVIEGQHMVKIPLFYYKRVPVQIEDVDRTEDDNEIGKQLVVWEDWVSRYPYEGYSVHPAFVRNGKVVPYLYFSAFEGSIFDTSANAYLKEDEQVADFATDLLCSIPNAKPCSGKTQNLTIENCRKLANNRSKSSEYEWFQQDFTTVSAIQMLITIAIGNYDCQVSVGRGVVDMPDTPNTENNSLKTGQTLNMGTLCGYQGTNGKSSVNFFGIENFWGNIWKFVDGFNIEAKNLHQGWVSNDDLTVNTNNNKSNLGFTMAKANGYMSRMGYDENLDFTFIPTATKSGEPISKDYFYQNKTHNGFLIARLGGAWNDGSTAGCFCWHVYNAASVRARHFGSRLACISRNFK